MFEIRVMVDNEGIVVLVVSYGIRQVGRAIISSSAATFSIGSRSQKRRSFHIQVFIFAFLYEN